MYCYKRLCVLLLAVGLPAAVQASAIDQLSRAANDGAVAFVLVTAPDAAGVDHAQRIVRSATIATPESVMIEVDRTSSAHSAFVSKYGLKTAPVPLVLVFASNGALAGGNPAAKLTAEQLVAMVPSPKKAEVIKAVQGGQAVYVTASRAGMTSNSAVSDVCAVACAQMNDKCVAIAVDMDDPAEKVLLQQLNIDTQSAEPVTVVVNAQGQVTGSFDGPVDVSKLVQAASTRVSSGCCPTGSDKSCGPTPPNAGK